MLTIVNNKNGADLTCFRALDASFMSSFYRTTVGGLFCIFFLVNMHFRKKIPMHNDKDVQEVEEHDLNSDI